MYDEMTGKCHVLMLIQRLVSHHDETGGYSHLLPVQGPCPLHQGQHGQVRATHGHGPLGLLRYGLSSGWLQDDGRREARRDRRGQGEGGGHQGHREAKGGGGRWPCDHPGGGSGAPGDWGGGSFVTDLATASGPGQRGESPETV